MLVYNDYVFVGGTMININENWERYKQLLLSSGREGVDQLIKYLEEKTDFKTAPASTKFHGNVEGGLCEHCLAVYDNLCTLNKAFDKRFADDSCIVVALLHDLAKINFYEQYDKNVKVNGQWVQEKHYKVRDLPNRFVYASHEQTSLFIAQQFIPLSIEEQVAILSHHGSIGDQNLNIMHVTDIYGTYSLPMFIHLADMIDAFKHE